VIVTQKGFSLPRFTSSETEPLYSLANWEKLEEDIRRFHLEQDVNLITETPYGIRYQISANLITPIERPLLVKTVWQIDINTDFPRLITLVLD
jgi:hypothetical protein